MRENRSSVSLPSVHYLWKFVPLNKRPDEVTVGEMLVPFFRIGPDESTKTAAKMMVENRITRLGGFEGENFLG